EAPSESVPYYLYCLRLRRLVLIFVNPLYLLWKIRNGCRGGDPLSLLFFCLYNFKGISGFYESCPILAIPVRG
ncbi:hypothetical protein, partial [Neisseria meningitidis]